MKLVIEMNEQRDGWIVRYRSKHVPPDRPAVVLNVEVTDEGVIERIQSYVDAVLFILGQNQLDELTQAKRRFHHCSDGICPNCDHGFRLEDLDEKLRRLQELEAAEAKGQKDPADQGEISTE